ncbi:MAG: dihydroxy-acid dehydratase, partial [Oscillospiraceae bacterium]|nr:dihydroxy-acid dehydratase [Oscillospiraceae bacterium]
DRPLIGIANSWNTANPGHYNLREVSRFVKQGIYQAGGPPVEFGIIGPCDGMGCGNDGMHYILPARGQIADSVETMVRLNHVDAVVLLGSCDKVIPGLLMAAARLDIPALLVNGGPMLGGMEFDGRESDNSSTVEALAMLQTGRISEREYVALEDGCCPGCGSCSFLGTANTMGAVAEALGMSLPGSSMIPAVMAERFRVAQASGRRIVEMVREGLTARKVISEAGLENALRLGMAIGGSTNMALHFPAIAYEARCPLSMDQVDEIARSTPHIAKIYPNGPKNVPAFDRAGGVPAVMKHLLPLLRTEAVTCLGVGWEEILADTPAVVNDMIRPLDNPWHSWGSLAVLRGNLAPDSCVTKPTAIDPGMLRFSGSARCFDSEDEAAAAVDGGEIAPGTVLVIRYEGPKGGPGMREMVRIMKKLYGRGLALSTAVITDGRFSGTNNGCFVGHISPEASEGGPIALVRDGDRITIDIPAGTLNMDVSKAELDQRRTEWVRPERRFSGYLSLYSRLAESADKGAIIKYY